MFNDSGDEAEHEGRFRLVCKRQGPRSSVEPSKQTNPPPPHQLAQNHMIMSFLPKSIGSRVLSSSARRLPLQAPLIHGRTYADNAAISDQPPGPRLGGSSLVKQEGPAESMVRHQPDYNVVTDYRTSYVWLAMKASIQHHAHCLAEHSLQSPSGWWMAANPARLCLQQSSQVHL